MTPNNNNAYIHQMQVHNYDLVDGAYIYEDVVAKNIAKLCKKVGIIQKSAHKSRKTYISKLLDNSVSLNYIRKQVGHNDERTALANYGFNSTRKSETEEKVAIILM